MKGGNRQPRKLQFNLNLCFNGIVTGLPALVGPQTKPNYVYTYSIVFVKKIKATCLNSILLSICYYWR